ncbi:MAG: DUF3017 domain-containing protein [Nocardioides sp.]
MTEDPRGLKPPEDVPPVSAERLVDGEVAVGPDAEARRYPSTIGGAFYLVILAVAVTGVAIAYFSDWRVGVRCIAAALVAASAIRLVLPTRDAGMLAVRSKPLDALLLAGTGIALIALAQTIPDQPTL